MGKLLTNQRRALMRIKTAPSNYRQLVALGNSVIKGLTASALVFLTPNPALAALQTAVDDLKNAINGIGTKKNKGSKADVLAAKDFADTLKKLLVQELGYVISVVELTMTPTQQAALLAQTGFAFRKVKAIKTSAQMPRLVRQTNNRAVPYTLAQIKFRKPNGTFKGQKLNQYAIWLLNGDGTKTFIKSVTKTVIDSADGIIRGKSYEIVPYNSRGNGNPFTINVV
jgi:hypothetical protein